MPKPPSLSPTPQPSQDEEARHSLNNGSDGITRFNQLRQAYAQEQARNPSGAILTDGAHWALLFEAARRALDAKLYPETEEQDTLRLALAEVMRPFRYDEEVWQKEGIIVFDESMVPEKRRKKSVSQRLSQRIAVVLRILTD